MPSVSLFPQKCQEKQNLQNGGKGLIHESIKCVNGRKEVQGGERQKEGNLMEKAGFYSFARDCSLDFHVNIFIPKRHKP